MTLLIVEGNVVSGLRTNSIHQPLSRSWLYVGGSGPGNYTKIQDAIDDAQQGDIIFVYDDSSPYMENLFIGKSIQLIGENKRTTIINSSDQETIWSFDYDNISIEGFTLLNSCTFTEETYGISLDFAENFTLTDTIISGCRWGIELAYCHNCSITNNEIREGTTGIELYHVDTSTLSENQLRDNEYGIELNNARTNTISDNVFTHNGMYLVDYAYPNFIVGNQVNGKALVYLENESDIIIDNESAGQIILVGCKHITMQNLTLSNATVGAEFINSNNCLLTKSTLRYNEIGVIFQENCIGNTVSSNNIDYNGYGITADQYFLFIRNKIIGNSIQSNSGEGIILTGVLNIVKNNLIKNNSVGIFIQSGILNLIQSNNIIKNKINAVFFMSVGTVFFWNYWKPNFGLRPKIIPGIQLGFLGSGYNIVPILFPWLKIDWFAARLPHTIPEQR